MHTSSDAQRPQRPPLARDGERPSASIPCLASLPLWQEREKPHTTKWRLSPAPPLSAAVNWVRLRCLNSSWTLAVACGREVQRGPWALQMGVAPTGVNQLGSQTVLGWEAGRARHTSPRVCSHRKCCCWDAEGVGTMGRWGPLLEDQPPLNPLHFTCSSNSCWCFWECGWKHPRPWASYSVFPSLSVPICKWGLWQCLFQSHEDSERERVGECSINPGDAYEDSNPCRRRGWAPPRDSLGTAHIHSHSGYVLVFSPGPRLPDDRDGFSSLSLCVQHLIWPEQWCFDHWVTGMMESRYQISSPGPSHPLAGYKPPPCCVRPQGGPFSPRPMSFV